MRPLSLHNIFAAVLAAVLIVVPDQTPYLMEVDAAGDGQAPPTAQPAETLAETTAEQAATPPQVSELPANVSAEETCTGKTEGSACWMELENKSGCYLWNYSLRVDETAAWTGVCVEGLAEGNGEINWVWGSNRDKRSTSIGLVQQGKRQGQWFIRYADGDVWEGPYMDGKKHGQWVFHLADGSVMEGPYVHDRQHGRWIFNKIDGGVEEGPYVDGKKRGKWILREADGKMWEGSYVDDIRHGEWVHQRVKDNGDVDFLIDKGSYVNGKKHGDWHHYARSQFLIQGKKSGRSRVEIGPYVDDVRHGEWMIAYSSSWSDSETGHYVDGKRQGVWTEFLPDKNDWEGPYVDDEKHGEWFETYPGRLTGIKKTGRTRNYVRGKLQE